MAENVPPPPAAEETDFFDYYHYDPSVAAAGIFIALFGISATMHVWQLLKNKTWYFIPFAIGGYCEVIGYIGRIISSGETPEWTMGPYIMQTIMLLVSAALLAASIYMVLGRIVVLLDGQHHSFIPIKWLSKIFVTADVISILMQCAGGAMLAIAETYDEFKTGEYVIIGGLFVQLLAFGVFITVSALFYRRMLLQPTAASQTVNVPWQQFMWVLFAGSSLILIRSAFRVIEYLQGNDGYLMSHEVFLYVFDAVLMLIVTVLFNVYHPSRIVSAKNHLFAKSVDQSQTELRTV
jgi:hypothetical protein